MASNMKAVKLRMKSIQSTKQITKAMELVASSKLRKAKEKAEATLPAFKILKNTLVDISSNNTDFTSVYVKPNYEQKYLYIVMAGDRGLAGGYNNNLFKFVLEQSAGKDCIFYPIGNKAEEFVNKNKLEKVFPEHMELGEVTISDCFLIASQICKAYREGQVGHVVLCYTEFQNMLTMKTMSIPVLPLRDLAGDDYDPKSIKNVIEYSPDPETVFNTIVPEFVANIIYNGVCESLASELASRRTAMDAATQNAEEMLKKLELSYNRARQASITQEITEIVAGAQSS